MKSEKKPKHLLLRKPMLYILAILLLLIGIPLAAFFYNQFVYTNAQKPVTENYLSTNENKLPKFDEKSIEGHKYTRDGYAMPFMDTKVFYPFSDNRVALFVTGGSGQKNMVHLYENGNFVNIASKLGLEGLDEAAYAMVSVDINNNGFNEVIVGYGSGIYMHSFNVETQKYSEGKKIAEVAEASIPHDITFADTRSTGLQDLFVSTFVDRKHFQSATYHDRTNKRENLYLVNNGDGTFSNQTEGSGLEIAENTYLSQFVDINGNGKPDLVVAMNTNRSFIYENLGNGKFKPHLLPIDYGFWMGLSVEKLSSTATKYHILLSNVGKSFPEFLLRGDLKKEEEFDGDFALLEQVADFEFKNVTFEKNLYSNVFGWGTRFVDLNNNGLKDAVLTENYIEFPLGIHKRFPSKGKVFMQTEDGKFAAVQNQLNLLNPHFGYRVEAFDFTGNGFNDVVIGNVDGPVKIFFNQGI